MLAPDNTNCPISPMKTVNVCVFVRRYKNHQSDIVAIVTRLLPYANAVFAIFGIQNILSMNGTTKF